MAEFISQCLATSLAFCIYHLQLLHPQLFTTLERHPLLLGVLQRVVPHGGAEADDHVHPAGEQR